MADVVILAPHDDLHARTVAFEVERTGGSAIVLDVADFPARWTLSYRASAATPFAFTLRLPDGRTVDERSLAGLWWRRTKACEIPPEVADKAHRRFCAAECRALIEGWAFALGDKVVNPLAAELVAGRRPFQLAAAAQCGLPIPESLITNDPAAAEAFAAPAPESRICKALTAFPDAAVFTRLLDRARLEDLHLLAAAPVILQEAIAGLDIRVTIVGDRLFPVQLVTTRPGAAFDWRRDPRVATEPHPLPGPTAEALLSLQRRLGLHYGAYDLRRDADGRYVFLEVNTAGQFLWAEIEAGQSISAALASLLVACPDATRPKTDAASGRVETRRHAS